MKNTNVKLLVISSAFALGFVAASPAQTMTTAPANTAPMASTTVPSDSGTGLLGQDYLSLDYGYLRNEQHADPLVRHDYGVGLNYALIPGLDLNVNYDYLSGSYQGSSIWRNQATAGLTAYTPLNSYLRPFVDGAVGLDWEHFADRFFTGGVNGIVGGPRDGEFTAILGGGVEIQVLRDFVVTPFAEYQTTHEEGQDWNWGIKATYRLSRELSVSLIPQIDAHRNLDYGAAVNYHF